MKSSWRLVVASTTLLVGYLVVQLQPVREQYQHWDKFAHAVAFFTIYLCLRWSLGFPVFVLVALSAVLGAAVELHQFFLPGFTPSFADWLADLSGIFVAVIFSFLLPWFMRKSAT